MAPGPVSGSVWNEAVLFLQTSYADHPDQEEVQTPENALYKGMNMLWAKLIKMASGERKKPAAQPSSSTATFSNEAATATSATANDAYYTVWPQAGYKGSRGGGFET